MFQDTYKDPFYFNISPILAIFNKFACLVIAQLYVWNANPKITGLDMLIPRSGEVEAVEVHYLVPHRYKVVNELFFRVITPVDFRQGTELGVRTED